MSVRSVDRAAVKVVFNDGTEVVEHTYSDHYTLRAAAPGHRTVVVKFALEPNSHQTRVAWAHFKAQKAALL